MKRLLSILLITALPALILAGCSKEKSEQDGAEESQTDMGHVENTDFGKRVVSINGQNITESEVAREEAMVMQRMASRLNPQQLESMKPNIRKQAVGSIVNRTLLMQAAESEGIEVSKEAITAKEDEIKKEFESEEALNEQLKKSGMTMKEVLEEVEMGMKVEELIKKQTAHVKKATDEDVEEFYNSNTERFRQPERVRASHVLVKVGAEDTEQTKSEKRRKIEKIQMDIKQGGDFAAIASEYSDCPSKASGGDLGFFSRGQMVKPFEDSAFALKPGEITGVVETKFGYHVIKLNEREGARTIPLNEVREDIADYLDRIKKQEEIKKYISGLHDAATIEYADSAPDTKPLN